MIAKLTPLLTIQAFLVAGGYKYNGGDVGIYVYALYRNAEEWTHLPYLPGYYHSPRASIVGGKIRLTGGEYAGYARNEVIPESKSRNPILGIEYKYQYLLDHLGK